jgi:3-oxoacyl-[acyl-carrier-protein] synthase III
VGSRIVNIGIYQKGSTDGVSTFDLISNAARICLDQPQYAPKDIDLVIHLSVYRTNDFVEPAMAAFIQRDLGINHRIDASDNRRTLSFDLSNGALGFLQGCQTLDATIASKKAKTGLIVGGNSMRFIGTYIGPQRAYSEVGIAVLIDEASRQGQGFSSFYFRSFPEHMPLFQSYLEHRDKQWYSIIDIHPSIENIYLDIFSRGVRDYLAKNKLDLDYFNYIVPPQISSRFVSEVKKMFGGNDNRYIDVTRDEGNLMSASESVALHYLMKRGLGNPGKRALIANVGSGLQLGCATYVF